MSPARRHRRRRRPQPARRRTIRSGALRLFLGLSALAHLQTAIVLLLIGALDPQGCAPQDTSWDNPVEVALVETEPEEQLKEEEKKEQEEEAKKKGQVVDLPRPVEERVPEKARYLSEYDTRTQKETKRPPRPRAQARRARPAPKGSSSKTKPSAAADPSSVLAMRFRPPPAPVPPSPLPPAERGRSSPKTPASRAAPQSAPPAPGQKNGITARLRLSDAELARALGPQPANDALDVEEGKSLLLNSRRWRYASFFNRIKRQVSQRWNPSREYQRRDPSGNVYGIKDRLTVLRVHLTPGGDLKDVFLEKPSGLAFLDNEAIRAFRAAHPFPNPPKGLVDKATGLISFRFGFMIEVSHRPNFKIFRF